MKVTFKLINDLFLEPVGENGEVVNLDGFFHLEGQNEVYKYSRVPESERVAGGLFWSDAHVLVGRNCAIKLKNGDTIISCK